MVLSPELALALALLLPSAAVVDDTFKLFNTLALVRRASIDLSAVLPGASWINLSASVTTTLIFSVSTGLKGEAEGGSNER